LWAQLAIVAGLSYLAHLYRHVLLWIVAGAGAIVVGIYLLPRGDAVYVSLGVVMIFFGIHLGSQAIMTLLGKA